MNEIERSELAHELLESVGEDGTFSPDVADAWHREIEKRIAEVENGEVELIDHEDFIRELRRLPTRRCRSSSGTTGVPGAKHGGRSTGTKHNARDSWTGSC